MERICAAVHICSAATQTPSRRQPGHAGSFVAHFRTVGVTAAFWWVLAANCLQVMAFMGMSSYLAPYLMRTYSLSAGETALPLTIAGLGVIAGSLMGGRVAGQAYRLAVVAIVFLGGGVAPLSSSPWTSHRGPRWQGALTLGATTLVATWFVRKRGRASVLTAFASPASQATFPVLAHVLITHLC